LGQAQKSLVTLTEAATPVLKQADRTLTGTTALMGSDSAVLNDLSRTLRSLDEAARAIRTLANSLERNPEMLIRGRSTYEPIMPQWLCPRVLVLCGVALLVLSGCLGSTPPTQFYLMPPLSSGD